MRERAGMKVKKHERSWRVGGMTNISRLSGERYFSGRLGGMADEAVKVGRSKIAKDLICCKNNYILKGAWTL